MKGASGVRVQDQDGRWYLDSMAGLWCVNIGYGREEVAQAIFEQSKKMSYFHIFTQMTHEPGIRLADRLLKLLPDNMARIFFGNSGSEANDTQVKLVWYYNNLRGKPTKKKIISRHRSYHGVTVAAGSLTGLPIVHKAFDLPISNILHTHAADYYGEAPAGMSEEAYTAHLASELDAMIEREGPETVGAFIAEPIMGTGGVLLPPKGYFQAIQKVLDKHDVLMIADEVICGFGRTGAWFGLDTYDIKPDLISLAKGLTSAYQPMSACVISQKVWDVILSGSRETGVFAHGFTYTGHPVAAAAAMANLDILDGEGLVAGAPEIGGYLQERLRAKFTDHPLVGQVRGIGMIAAVELKADKKSKTSFDASLLVGRRVTMKAHDLGLISRALPGGDHISFAPPLCITRSEVDEITDLFEKALNSVMDELVSEGAWKG